MPAARPIPTLESFLQAYGASVHADAGSERNLRRGSGYDKLGGPAALLWAREATRDRDVFRQCYIETANGEALSRLVERKYGAERTEAGFGTGTAIFTRHTSGTSGTLYAGTRVLLATDEGRPRPYAVASDTPVDSSTLSLPVPIRATKQGPGVAVATSTGLSLGDSVFDAGLKVTYLACADGTEDEPKAEYIDRARSERLDRRVGYRKRVEQACIDAGAANVVILDAGAFGEAADFGVTHVYVADAGFSTPSALLTACRLAVDAVHVAGCDVQVLGMAITPLTTTATITLWDQPGTLDQIAIKRNALNALLAEFLRRTDAWLFRYDALAGAVFGTSSAIRDVVVTSSPAEPVAGFVSVLPRYVLSGTDVTLTLVAPS
jgi:hypothetical protein